jgi:hypothetical protein
MSEFFGSSDLRLRNMIDNICNVPLSREWPAPYMLFSNRSDDTLKLKCCGSDTPRYLAHAKGLGSVS